MSIKKETENLEKTKASLRENFRNLVLETLRKNEHEDLDLSNTDVTVENSQDRGSAFVVIIKKHGGLSHLGKILKALEEETWEPKDVSIVTIAPNNLTNQDLEVHIII